MRRMKSRRSLTFGTICSAVLLTIFVLVVWEAVVKLFRIPPFLLPPASAVIREIYGNPKYFIYNSWITLIETVLGFVAGSILGILGGIGIHYSPLLRRALYPILIAFNTIPKVALAPLFLVWFGYGLIPKVMIALLIAFFPLVVSTVDGLASVPAELIELAEVLHAREWDRFRKVSFIHSLPNIFTGLKVSMAMAVGGAVVAEFIGSPKGLGFLIVMANTSVNLASMFSAFVFLTVMALGLFYLVELLQKAVIPWAQTKTE